MGLNLKQALSNPAIADAVRAWRQPTESDLHEQIKRWCSVQAVPWLTHHSRMDAATTTERGAPDFIIIAPEGRLLLIECKTERGKLSTHQEAWHAWARKLGHSVVVVRSFAEFSALVGAMFPRVEQ